MERNKFNSKEECIAAIKTLKAIGAEPTPWMLEQFEENGVHYEKDGVASFWETLKSHYRYGEMPQEKIQCVENTVQKLMEDGPRAEEPGLLLGKIQCGKTDTFEDIIGLAFDKGIDVAIVITKGTRALVNQTIKRMEKDFRFFKKSDTIGQKAILIHDIMKIKRGGLAKADVDKYKTVIVCKKQAENLKHLINLFSEKNPFLKEKKVLVVDDEADFASRNYQNVSVMGQTDEEGNPIPQKRETKLARISEQIDEFRKIPTYCRYLQVTATPYCLYLQPGGKLNLDGNFVKPFKPRFTELVPIHNKYVGGKQYFELSKNPTSMYSCLFHQIEQKCLDVMKKENRVYLNRIRSSENIYGLTYAIMSYFMATAIRNIQVREAKDKYYPTSAVFHVQVGKKNHDWEHRLIERVVNDIKNAVVDENLSDKRVVRAFNIAYDDFCLSNKLGREYDEAGRLPGEDGFTHQLINVEMPSKEDIKDEIRSIFQQNGYSIKTVNSDNEMDELLDAETGELELETTANIFIGGNILDRGVTIKNMLCFFYGRDPRHFQQDTVLQHARMYGARSMEDMAVMRFHTTDSLHKIMERINELDNQLRDWFIKGKDTEEPNAVFVGFDKNIKPCAPQKILVSNAITLKSQKRILPIGFWTGSNTKISKIIKQIDELITSTPDYQHKDENGFFKIEKERVQEILKLVRMTYVYDADEKKFNNIDRQNDIQELLCALEYCTEKSNGEIYALHRLNRDMKRLRDNGGYIDAPDDGRTDTAPSRLKAIDAPVIMFIRENGNREINEMGDNVGWNNAPFYWPVLMTQQNIDPVMFAIDQKDRGLVTTMDISDIMEGINPDEMLNLTFHGDLEERFGSEGAEYDEENAPDPEVRAIKHTTAARYIFKDDKGDWLHNPSVPFDEEHDHGVYSKNNEKFPFVLKPYKYMLLRNGRDARADVMLLELAEQPDWNVYSDGYINENGDLEDRDTGEILVHGRDTLTDKNLNSSEFVDDTITQWFIEYPIKKVLKLRKFRIDWNKLFESDDE